MAQGDEVRIFGEAVDHRQNDRLAIDLGQALDEIHGDVGPYLGRHVEGLQQTSRLQRLRLVPLTSVARPNEVLDEGTITVNEEITTETMCHQTISASILTQQITKPTC